MSNANTELERWLAGEDIFEERDPGTDEWVADFDADRQAVVLKLGPYKRLYLRPQKFTKRFYHQLYPLKIETWPYRRQIKLFDDFCTLDMALNIRFQATLSYAQRNSEILANINQHIKQSYADLLEDIVNRALRNLDDGSWVQTGLTSVEQAIANSICELLAIQHIQAQVSCDIAASFEEFPAVQPGRENVYLQVLKKTFEINDRKHREISRQQRILERQELEERQRGLEHLKELAELESQAQALEAEKNRRLLEEQEDQLLLRLEIEKRIHSEKVKHEAELKAMSLDSELRFQEQYQAKQRLAEIQRLNDELAHLTEIQDKKALAELVRREGDQIAPKDRSFANGGGGGEDADQ